MADTPDTAKPASYDPYALSRADVREAPPLNRAFREIGPGLILAASIVGTGELIATTHAGASAGFAILWLVILSCFIKVFVQIELGRHAVSTGETTLTSFSKLPGPGKLLVWWWFFMMFTTQPQISAMIGGVGYTMHMTVPEATGGLERPGLPWAVLTAVLSAVLLIYGTYRLIERTMTVMVALFTLLTVVCVVLLPFNEEFSFGWSEIGSGLTFDLPREKAVILAAITMVGITGVGASELISYPYWCIEKGYARNVGPNDGSAGWLRRARGWLAVMKLDAWVSMVIYTVATVAFFILGAAILHAGEGKGLPDKLSEMLPKLAEMYAPVLGPRSAKLFIVVGAFVVLFSTLIAATAANARTGTDFLRVSGLVKLTGPDHRFRWVQRFSVGLLAFSLTLFVFFPNPVLMVMIGGFAQALTLPMIAAAAIYMHYKRGDRRLTPGLVWRIFLWLSFLALVAAAAYGAWSQVADLI